MSAPGEVRLKRKRTDDPLESLLLTRAQHTGDSPSKKIRYVLKAAVKTAVKPQAESTSSAAVSQRDDAVQPSASISTPEDKKPISRTFHLKRPRAADDDEYGTKRSRGNGYNVPTFEEDSSRVQKTPQSHAATDSPSSQAEIYRTKRPGRGSALRDGTLRGQQNGTPKSNVDMQALADSMHQFALDELAKIPKPTTKTKPRMSPAQSKARHDRLMASASASPASTPASDAMELDESDFVYDTYVLTDSIKGESHFEGDVGLLVIHDDDEEYWQSLLDVEEQEEEVDEEDENAEDHYAADYPEDELASDDEYDHNAYSFRPRANSDLEQWDHRYADDDDEEDSAPFSMRSQVVKRWEEELGIAPFHTADSTKM